MHFSKICRVTPQPVVLLFLVFSRIRSNGLIYELLQRFRLIPVSYTHLTLPTIYSV